MSASTHSPGCASQVHARVAALIDEVGLPREVEWLGAGCGVAALRMAGEHPLDDLLAWAGEMAGEPHWWTVRHHEHVKREQDRVDLFASGVVRGLAVTVSAPAPSGLAPCPSTAQVIECAYAAAAAQARGEAGAARPR